MAFQDADIEGGHDYAKTKRHYPYQDYFETTVVGGAAPIFYIVGLCMGAPGTWGAKDVLFWGDQDFFISFNVQMPNVPLGLPLLIRIPANTYVRYHPHSAFTIYLASLVNANVRVWMEGG